MPFDEILAELNTILPEPFHRARLSGWEKMKARQVWEKIGSLPRFRAALIGIRENPFLMGHGGREPATLTVVLDELHGYIEEDRDQGAQGQAASGA